jgi:hypothetical protein
MSSFVGRRDGANIGAAGIAARFGPGTGSRVGAAKNLFEGNSVGATIAARVGPLDGESEAGMGATVVSPRNPGVDVGDNKSVADSSSGFSSFIFLSMSFMVDKNRVGDWSVPARSAIC